MIANLEAIPFEAAWHARVHESITVAGRTVPVWILGLTELRETKKHAGRPKDLDDLDHLRPA